MSASDSTCTMCGDRFAEIYSGYRLPAPCVQLLDGGDDVDPSTIAGEIAVDLCEDCTDIARRMVRDHDTSPLPECDAEAASWSDTATASALTGGDVDESAGVDERTITDAAAVVNAHKDGDTERLLPSKIDEAYITLWSLQELGFLDTEA